MPRQAAALRGAKSRDLFTVKEAAAALGVSVRTTWRLLRTGALRSVQFGKLRRIRCDDVELLKVSGGATR